ncbi:MAG: hypothetical protein QOE28_2685 [Solirubrobacteraceae bacterium]|nr:hypothetical protein [Solirubrobacteraceae bacterium]
MHLCEEGGDWVLAADLMAVCDQQLVPGSVVDLPVGAPLGLEDLDGDLLQPLPAQPRRQLFNPQLARDSQRASEFLEEMLVSSRALLESISEASQPIGLSALSFDAREQHLVLAAQA